MPRYGSATDDILLVCSGGGHLRQLAGFAERIGIPPEQQVWVTFDNGLSRSLLAGRRVIHLPFIGPRDLRHFSEALWHSPGGVFRDRRFAEAISTGSSPAVAFLPQAAARGIPSYYIESAARADGPSLTGKLIAASGRSRPSRSTRRGRTRGGSSAGRSSTSSSRPSAPRPHRSRERPSSRSARKRGGIRSSGCFVRSCRSSRTSTRSCGRRAMRMSRGGSASTGSQACRTRTCRARWREPTSWCRTRVWARRSPRSARGSIRSSFRVKRSTASMSTTIRCRSPASSSGGALRPSKGR